MSQSDSAISNHLQAIQTENLPKIGIRPIIDGRSAFDASYCTSADYRACANFGPIYG